MNSKKEKLLNDTYQKWMQIGLYDLPLDGANNFVDPEIMGYGTAIDEKVLSISDYRDLINRQREQAAGLEMNFETTPVFRSISNKEDSAFFVDEIKVSIMLKEGNQELFLRMTTILEYVDSKWIVVHWHGSMPTETLAETDTWLVNEWKRKNEKLQKLVDEKTFELLNKNRELEIETALEKVRTIAMGMKKPADMVEVCKAISEQLEHLGIKDIRNVQTAIINEGKGTYLNYQYFAAYDQGIIEETKYNKHPRVFEMVQEMKKSADAFFSGSFDGEELKKFREYRKLDNQFHDPILDEVPHLQYNFYSIGLGGLGLTTYKNLSPEGLDIFRRFHKVFSLAYKRFIDIEKAESQTREAEIQLALERVRARSLAMHHTSELQDVVNILAQQLHQIGLDINGGVFITINDEVDETIPLWASAGAADYVQKAVAPFLNKPIFTHLRDAIKRGNNFFTEAYSKEEKDEMFRHLFNYDPWKATSTDRKKELLSREGGLTRSAIISNHTSIAITNHYGKKFSNEDHDILKRFGNVFEQSYIRFLDLQKAESQAREAQIEASLERVRAHAMGLRSSDELSNIIAIIFEELKKLGLSLYECGICIRNRNTRDFTYWGSGSEDVPLPLSYHFPFFDHPILNNVLLALNEKVTYREFTVAGKELEEYGNLLFTLTDFNAAPKEYKESFLSLEKVFVGHAYMQNGFVEAVGNEPIPVEIAEVLKRFTNVIDLTYTRFLDLQKAETQAREAQIEASIEKIRSRSLAMQKPRELVEVAELLRKEMGYLGVEELETSSIYIVDNENQQAECWYAIKDIREENKGLVRDEMTLTLSDTWVGNEMWKFYRSKKEQTSIIMKGDNRKEWINYCADQSQVLQGYYGSEIPERTYHLVKFNGGYMGAASPGEISSESWDLLKRAAAVFSLAYTRFKDLQDAEARAREAQIEAALERVRSRTMGMQRSEELKHVIRIVYEQFVHLKINVDHAGFVVDYKPKGDWHFWIADEQDIPSKITHPYFESVWADQFNEAKEKGADFFATNLIFEEKNKFYTELLSYVPGLPEASKDFYLSCPGLAISTVLLDNVSLYIENFSGTPYSDEDNKILMHFGKVFQQTYTRFLDLQKAEAQAREAEIELALERVRARTMAMQSSDELQEASVLLFQQVVALGVPAFGSGFNIWDDDRKYATAWMAGQDRLQPPFKTSSSEDIFLRIYEAAKKGESLFVEEQADEALKIHYNYMLSIPVFKEIADKMAEVGQSFPTFQIMHCAFFSHGYLMFISFEPVPDAYDIFKRFAKAFEQTYTRFLDLQKAEAQAREAQIELSLERIRSQVTAMRESSELLDIVVTMRSEYIALGHEAHYFWHMRWLPEKYEKAMTSGDGTRIGMIMELPRGFHKDQRMLDWEKTKEPIGIFTYDADGAIDYVDKMIQTGRFDLVDHNAPGPDDIRAIGGITFVMARTTHGEIGYSLPGVVPYPPAEDLSTLVRFAGVFDLAYKRFEDLKKAERQKREAEIELALERTRNQSMLMQHSDELNEISKTFHEQLLLLGIDSEFSFVWLPDEEKNEHMFWATWVIEVDKVPNYHSRAIKYPLDKNEPGTAACYLAWESGESVHETYVPPGDIVAFFATWEELLRGAEQFKPELFPEGIYYTEAYMKYGCFGIDIRRQLSADEKEIIRRFAVEFERTYTRFLDLQKVEAQNMMIQADNDRKTKELEDARQLQLSMLPKELPKLPHLDIAVYMKTATEVGGDYYDFNVDDNGTLTVLVGDATGHGMMSGMMVSIMKSFFISNRSSIDLKQLFENSNNSLKEMQLGRLMMPLIGVQFNSEKLIATNAGMPSLLYFRNKSQKAGEFVSNNLPLGGMKGTQYLLKEISYEKGDTLLLMSDGFAELRNENQQQYGYTRIKEQFGPIVHKSAAEIIEELKNSAAQWLNGSEPDDDVTFVVIKVK